MLREVKNAHLKPCLYPLAATSSGSTATAVSGGSDFTLTSGGTGQVTATFKSPLSRAAVCVATPSSANVAANGSAYLSAAPTVAAATLVTQAAGSPDDGTVYAILCPFGSNETLSFQHDAHVVRSSVDRPILHAFKVDTTTSGTINIGARHASISRAGTGDVTLTFSRPFGGSQVVAVATPILGTRAEIGIHSISATAVRVKLTVAGTGTDGSFYLMVLGSDSRDSVWGRRRIVENTQRHPRFMPIVITYTAGAPAVTVGSGLVTLTDTGTGDVALAFAKPFKREPIVVASSVGAGLVTVKAAATASGVSITNFDTGGSAADPTAIHLFVLGFDDATEY